MYFDHIPSHNSYQIIPTSVPTELHALSLKTKWKSMQIIYMRQKILKWIKTTHKNMDSICCWLFTPGPGTWPGVWLIYPVTVPSPPFSPPLFRLKDPSQKKRQNNYERWRWGWLQGNSMFQTQRDWHTYHLMELWVCDNKDKTFTGSH